MNFQEPGQGEQEEERAPTYLNQKKMPTVGPNIGLRPPMMPLGPSNLVWLPLPHTVNGQP